jgi:hypothetical protein
MAMQAWPNFRLLPKRRAPVFNTEWPACATQIQHAQALADFAEVVLFTARVTTSPPARPAKAYAQQVSVRKDD